MSRLTAIDILVNPDDATVERATAVNARLRESVSTGYALDETRQPHITTLQLYVRSADLDKVFAAAAATITATDTSSLGYEATMIRHGDGDAPDQGHAAYIVKRSPEVLTFQAALLECLTPYSESHGTAAAFVTDGGDPDINETTLKWVEHFVPNQMGNHYIPHISLGFATIEDLEVIEAEPFEHFRIHPASFAICHLGNNGVARRELKRWKA